MDNTVRITFAGDPRGAGRPRFRVVASKNGKPFASAYTDKDTRDYQDNLRYQCQRAMKGRPLFKGPVSVVLRIYMRIPASWSAKKQALALSGAIRPIVKPDIDNIFKNCSDPMNGVVWLDDSQIVILRALKLYSDHPSVEIEITEVEGMLPSQEQPQLFER